MLGVFLDSETNGLNPRLHRIVEIAFKIVDLLNGEVKEEFQAVLSLTEEEWGKSDPTSLQVNEFSWEEVKGGALSSLVAQEIIQIFQKWNIQRKKAVFICQNPSFDRVFFSHLIDPTQQEQLNWPYHWLDLASMHWALAMEKAKKHQGPLPWEIGYSKDLIASFYQIPPERKPHRAMNGVTHLLSCYQAVVGFPNGNDTKCTSCSQ